MKQEKKERFGLYVTLPKVSHFSLHLCAVYSFYFITLPIFFGQSSLLKLYIPIHYQLITSTHHTRSPPPALSVINDANVSFFFHNFFCNFFWFYRYIKAFFFPSSHFFFFFFSRIECVFLFFLFFHTHTYIHTNHIQYSSLFLQCNALAL